MAPWTLTQGRALLLPDKPADTITARSTEKELNSTFLDPFEGACMNRHIHYSNGSAPS